MQEAKIIIEGDELSQEASMTVRVAIENFATYLSDTDYNGYYRFRGELRDKYMKQIYIIRESIYKGAK